jgi:hypothetical protein
MPSQVRDGAVPSLVAPGSMPRHRVCVGRCPAPLVTKSCPSSIGWRHSSHRSDGAPSAVDSGLSTCGGNHAAVLPNISLQVTGLWAASLMTPPFSTFGSIQSSVFPNTTRHALWQLLPAAILTSRHRRTPPARAPPIAEGTYPFPHKTSQDVDSMRHICRRPQLTHSSPSPYRAKMPQGQLSHWIAHSSLSGRNTSASPPELLFEPVLQDPGSRYARALQEE